MRKISLYVLGLCLLPLLTLNANAEIAQADLASAFEKYLQTDAGRESVGKAAQAYFKNLQEQSRKDQEDREKGQLEDQFKNPVKMDIGKSPVKGPATAKVTIIEFSDFECPFCTRGKTTMEEVLKAYPNDVKVAFKNLPLPFHKNALPAAKAGIAAGNQGKFWEMHDKMFDNQKTLSQEFYEATAKELGLDVAKFKTDMESAETIAQIEADKKLAEANGIQGTPGFFVNGVAVKGAYPFDHFQKLIDRWLGKTTAAPEAVKG
ncbi:MAG: thioredoxin domain-containing protein [bacterium]|nr:thioredoxin domain-containing protein [bacterium]